MKPTFRLLVIENGLFWSSMDFKLASIASFFSSVCTLNITRVRYDAPLNVAYASYPDVAPLSIIGRDWYDRVIATPYAGLADIILFVTPFSKTFTTPRGVMTLNNVGPWEATVFVNDESERVYVSGQDFGNAFEHYATHELSHVFYHMLGLRDDTHVHFPVGQEIWNVKPLAVLYDFDFSTKWFKMERIRDALLAILTQLNLLKKKTVKTVVS